MEKGLFTPEGFIMNRKDTHEHLRYTILAAMFAAMIYVMTAFVHIPTQQGYIHIGDGIIFLAAALLPAPYAMGAAAVGAGLSDYLSGFAIWVLPTVIIKAATAAVFTNGRQTIVNRRNLIACAVAWLICVGGYYISGVVLALLSGGEIHSALAAALADIPTNIMQCVGSTALYIFLGFALDKMGFKSMLSGKRERYRA